MTNQLISMLAKYLCRVDVVLYHTPYHRVYMDTSVAFLTLHRVEVEGVL